MDGLTHSENRRYEILKRESEINNLQNSRNQSAIVAGLCLLGAVASFHLGGQDINVVIQHELEALYSWEAIGQYLKDLGPITTLLTVSASSFFSQYLKDSKKLKQARQDFENLNAAIGNINDLGGNENAKSR